MVRKPGHIHRDTAVGGYFSNESQKILMNSEGDNQLLYCILYFPIPHNALHLGGQAEIQDGWLCGQLRFPWVKTNFVVRQNVLIGGIGKKIYNSTEFLKTRSYGKYGCFV